jgi:hypothetical protein
MNGIFGMPDRLLVTGQLNCSGLQSVLDLRILFKLTPYLGKDLTTYYDENLSAESV